MTFSGKDIAVPSGEFQVTRQEVANHIRKTARKWGKKVSLISGEEKEITEEIKPKNSTVTTEINDAAKKAEAEEKKAAKKEAVKKEAAKKVEIAKKAEEAAEEAAEKEAVAVAKAKEAGGEK